MDAERKHPPEKLQDFTGYLLRRAYLAAIEAANAAIPPPHRMRELLILLLLREQGPLSQQELAGMLQVNRTIMVGLIDALEDAGLVRRERNPADRRSYALAPTDLGRKTLRSLEPALARAERILTRRLTGAERRRLQKALLRAVPGPLQGGPLAARTGSLIKFAHHARRQLATSALAGVELEPRQFGALLTVREHQPCSQQELAAALGVTPPVVLPLADELEEAGLLQRARNRADRRLYDLTLTGAGEQRVTDALRIVRRLPSEDRSDPRVRELHTLLRKLLGG